MRVVHSYRYFLGIRPHPRFYPAFQAFAEAAGQSLHLGRVHLTLCVVAECVRRDRGVLRRVRAALAGQPLHAFPVNLSRIVTGPHGATARPSGRQADIQDFYRRLAGLLRAREIEPLYRRAGLHPHMTLGYDPCPAALVRVALQWFPTDLLLIESEVGLTRHTVLGRWPLLPPRQPFLPFGDRFDGPAIAATDPAPRSAA